MALTTNAAPIVTEVDSAKVVVVVAVLIVLVVLRVVVVVVVVVAAIIRITIKVAHRSERTKTT